MKEEKSLQQKSFRNRLQTHKGLKSIFNVRIMNQIDIRQIRVFISSTFEDMKDERDYLIKKVFPELRQEAAKRNVSLVEVDLRWGITEKEAKKGRVVDICFDEIDNSIPFFIGIIGNRYGWCPEEKDVSIDECRHYNSIKKYIKRHLSATEMEIQYGVLEREEPIYASFYINSQEDSNRIDYPERLKILKEKIKKNKRYPFYEYNSIESLGEKVQNSFIHLLDVLFPVDAQLSEVERAKISHEANIRLLCSSYIPDERRFSRLDKFLKESKRKQLLIWGDSGVGKSAFVAEWVRRNQNIHNVVYYAVGCYGNYRDKETVLKHISLLIIDKYKLEYKESQQDLDYLLNSIVERDEELILVIDAFDQIEFSSKDEDITWLPTPKGKVKYIITTVTDWGAKSPLHVNLSLMDFDRDNVEQECVSREETEKLERVNSIIPERTISIIHKLYYRGGSLKYHFTPYAKQIRREIIIERLRRCGKNIDSSLVNIITAQKVFCNTFAINVLIDELIVQAKHETIRTELDRYLCCNSIESFFMAVLERYEKDYGYWLTRNSLSLLAISNSGLNETELRDLINADIDCKKENLPLGGLITPLQWSQFYCAFYDYFSFHEGGLLVFSHPLIKNVIIKKYVFPDEDYTAALRYNIIKKFKDKETVRAYVELCCHYYELGLYEELYQLICSPTVLYSLIKNHWELLMSIWVDLCVYNSEPYSLSDFICAWERLDESRRTDSYNAAELLLISIISDQQGYWPPNPCPEEFARMQELCIPYQKNKHGFYHYSYNSGAGYMHTPEKMEHALELLLQAMHIIEDSVESKWDKYYKDRLECYNKIAKWYQLQGCCNEELHYLERALAFVEETSPEDWDNYGDVLQECYYAIAQCYHTQGNRDEEIYYLKRFIGPCESYYGKIHPKTQFAYYIVGYMYYEKEDHIEAIDHLKMSLIVAEGLKDNDMIIQVCNGLVQSYEAAINKEGYGFNNLDNVLKYLEYYERMAIALKEKGQIKDYKYIMKNICEMKKDL